MPPIELDLPVPKPEIDEWGGKLNANILVLLQAVNDSVADIAVVDGHLFAVHVDGSQTDLGPLPVGPPGGVNKVAGQQGDVGAQQLVDAIATPLSAQSVRVGNVPVSYTWDATTGFIATITEHYPAPLGNRVTTYSAYGANGPTHEVDPDGGQWTLTYDANGNQSERQAA